LEKQKIKVTIVKERRVKEGAYLEEPCTHFLSSKPALFFVSDRLQQSTQSASANPEATVRDARRQRAE